MTPGASLTAGEVAARFRRSRDWLYRARAALEQLGFPRPVPTPPSRARRGRGRPEYIWDQEAVETWFKLQAPAALWPAMGLDLAANENAPQADKAAGAARGKATLERRLL